MCFNIFTFPNESHTSFVRDMCSALCLSYMFIFGARAFSVAVFCTRLSRHSQTCKIFSPTVRLGVYACTAQCTMHMDRCYVCFPWYRCRPKYILYISDLPLCMLCAACVRVRVFFFFHLMVQHTSDRQSEYYTEFGVLNDIWYILAILGNTLLLSTHSSCVMLFFLYSIYAPIRSHFFVVG